MGLFGKPLPTTDQTSKSNGLMDLINWSAGKSAKPNGLQQLIDFATPGKTSSPFSAPSTNGTGAQYGPPMLPPMSITSRGSPYQSAYDFVKRNPLDVINSMIDEANLNRVVDEHMSGVAGAHDAAVQRLQAIADQAAADSDSLIAAQGQSDQGTIDAIKQNQDQSRGYQQQLAANLAKEQGQGMLATSPVPMPTASERQLQIDKANSAQVASAETTRSNNTAQFRAMGEARKATAASGINAVEADKGKELANRGLMLEDLKRQARAEADQRYGILSNNASNLINLDQQELNRIYAQFNADRDFQQNQQNFQFQQQQFGAEQGQQSFQNNLALQELQIKQQELAKAQAIGVNSASAVGQQAADKFAQFMKAVNWNANSPQANDMFNNYFDTAGSNVDKIAQLLVQAKRSNPNMSVMQLKNVLQSTIASMPGADLTSTDLNEAMRKINFPNTTPPSTLFGRRTGGVR